MLKSHIISLQTLLMVIVICVISSNSFSQKAGRKKSFFHLNLFKKNPSYNGGLASARHSENLSNSRSAYNKGSLKSQLKRERRGFGGLFLKSKAKTDFVKDMKKERRDFGSGKITKGEKRGFFLFRRKGVSYKKGKKHRLGIFDFKGR